MKTDDILKRNWELEDRAAFLDLIKHLEGLPTYKRFGDIRGEEVYINKQDVIDYLQTTNN